MKWSCSRFSERPSICLQMELFFYSCTRKPRTKSPHAGECVILLCHSELRLSFPLKCLHWRSIMTLVSTPQPPIRLIRPSFSTDKCQSAFFSNSQLTKRPYLTGGHCGLVVNSQITLIMGMSFHNLISIHFCGEGQAGLTWWEGFSLRQRLLAPPLIILTAWAKFKWPIKFTH